MTSPVGWPKRLAASLEDQTLSSMPVGGLHVVKPSRSETTVRRRLATDVTKYDQSVGANDWRGFERLAEQIFAGMMPFATVKWNDHIQGILSGAMRQIDVTARWEVDGEAYLLILQAKNYARPADVNTVGGFKSVMQDVEASNGVLICNAGFTSAAINYAERLGIALLNLHDAESRDWSRDLTVPFLWIDYIPNLSRSFVVEAQEGDTILDQPLWLSPDGGTTFVDIDRSFVAGWNGGLFSAETGRSTIILPPAASSVAVVDSAGQHAWRPCAEIQISYSVSKTVRLGRYRPSKCRGIIEFIAGESSSLQPIFVDLGDFPSGPDDSWIEIEDESDLAVHVRGTLLTSTGYTINDKEPSMLTCSANYVGPIPASGSASAS